MTVKSPTIILNNRGRDACSASASIKAAPKKRWLRSRPLSPDRRRRCLRERPRSDRASPIAASTAAIDFVTTKLWISDYGYDQTLHAFDRSMRKLGLEQLDLYPALADAE